MTTLFKAYIQEKTDLKVVVGRGENQPFYTKASEAQELVNLQNWVVRDFPGGAAVKNPPASAGDMGSSPGLGRSHMARNSYAHAPQLPSLHSRARKPQLLKPACLEPMLCNKRNHYNEKPAHHNEE